MVRHPCTTHTPGYRCNIFNTVLYWSFVVGVVQYYVQDFLQGGQWCYVESDSAAEVIFNALDVVVERVFLEGALLGRRHPERPEKEFCSILTRYFSRRVSHTHHLIFLNAPCKCLFGKWMIPCVADLGFQGHNLEGESPTSFPEDTPMPFLGFKPEPTRLQRYGDYECHKHHTRWSGRNVLLLIMHNDGAIDLATGDLRKPEISFYNLTKRAVDVVDEMIATYSQRLENVIAGL
ncbi:hypothetical protein TNCV_38031 [Trichonephila clavipes]|nr:hypothetical protein TNCV_38031 [Trichonephila clavipes]